MRSHLPNRRQALSLGLAACALVVAAAIAGVLLWPPGVPLAAAGGPGPDAAQLPAGCVVANALADTPVTAPFAVVASAASPSGWAVALAEGQGDKQRNAGRATFQAAVGAGDRFRLWLRCRWSDSCGNSLGIELGPEPVTIGQDAVYGQWHWVEAGEIEAKAGELALTLHEREDGVAVDQALLCPADLAFVPAGPILAGGRQAAGLRRFADSFDRSPGHGTEGWQFEAGTWELAFSLDPNRIPLQYALNATAPAGQWGVARLAGDPWRGAALRATVCAEGGESAVGVLFEAADGPVAVVAGGAEALPDLAGVRVLRAAGVSLVPGQWYCLEAERWGWSVRLSVDGVERLRADGLPVPGAGVPALLVAGTPAVFDDVRVEEIGWAADDGGDFRLDWVAEPGARWYRPRRPDADWCLAGRTGSLRVEAPAGAGVEVLLEGLAGAPARLRVPGFAAQSRAEDRVVFAAPGAGSPAVALAAEGACRFRRVVIRGALPEAVDESYPFGLYHFSEANVADIADYLDFTPEEYRAIAASPEAERLRRQAKEFPVVGSSSDYAIWASESGHWAVREGVLQGNGRNAAVRFWQALNGPFGVQFRVRLRDAAAGVRLVLAESGGSGIEVRVAGPAAGPSNGGPGAAVAPGEWHAVEAALSERTLRWCIDGGTPGTQTVQRGTGGGVLLRVDSGAAEFDDVLISVPRRTDEPGARSRFYAFDRREADWWRRGQWIDHGGIACAVASSWVSLAAPDSEGWLVHKESFGGDLLVAFNVEESTDWHGWDREPSHTHCPADNIGVVLACGSDLQQGYRLEVNSRDRRLTVLSRHGKDVASVAQDASFPIQYVGGHAPYQPRRNRICLVRQGALLRAVINGLEVLSYRDPEPLVTPAVAIGGHRTQLNLSNVQIRELPPEPEGVQPEP